MILHCVLNSCADKCHVNKLVPLGGKFYTFPPFVTTAKKNTVGNAYHIESRCCYDFLFYLITR